MAEDERRKMVGKRIGPHQLIEVTVSVTRNGYGNMSYVQREIRYECGCKKMKRFGPPSFTGDFASRDAIVKSNWLEHILEDLVPRVYDYAPPKCSCQMLIGGWY